MNRFDGTAARQLDLIEPLDDQPRITVMRRGRPTLRLLKDDVYAEILRRRRRAQIAARHAVAEAKNR